MTAGQRLLARAAGHSLDLHIGMHGLLPMRAVKRPGHLVETLDAAGLRGRGGGWFPTARKLAAVDRSRGRAPVVVVNAMEGEPLSGKDGHLLCAVPHLVLDGATLAARALGARQIMLAVKGRTADLTRLTAERALRGVDPIEITVAAGPDRYLAGQEAGLVNWLGGGPPLPTTGRPYERGIARRPTFVSNAETYAHLALIARHGPDWFRRAGTPDAPGTTLITLSGAVADPGVVEVPVGTPVHEVIQLAGGLREPARAVLFGGYGGAWIAVDSAGALPLAPEPLKAAGTALGPGIVAVLPASTCGIAQTAAIARWMAGHGAGQCGPCRFGLPAVADDLDQLAASRADHRTLARLRRRVGLLPGRGACAHPDGTARLVAGALEVFGAEVERHLRGMCGLCATQASTVNAGVKI